MTGYSSRRSSCAPHGWSSPFSAELAGPDGLRAGQGPSDAASAARGRRSQRADRDDLGPAGASPRPVNSALYDTGVKTRITRYLLPRPTPSSNFLYEPSMERL